MDIETFVARLALNPAFREKFLDEPDAVSESAGIELAPQEVMTLVRVSELLDFGSIGSDEASFDLGGQELVGPPPDTGN